MRWSIDVDTRHFDSNRGRFDVNFQRSYIERRKRYEKSNVDVTTLNRRVRGDCCVPAFEMSVVRAPGTTKHLDGQLEIVTWLAVGQPLIFRTLLCTILKLNT